MISWFRQHRRVAVMIGLTLAVPLYFYLKTLFGLIGLGIEYRGERHRLEPRLARLEGLLLKEAEVAEQSGLAAEALRAQVYADGQDPSTLAAAVQADVRQIFAGAGMSISNSQVLPTRQVENFDLVAVKLTVSGSLSSLDAALIGVAAHQPRMLVETIDAFPGRSSSRRGKDEEQLLTAVIQLLVLRALR